MVTYIIASPHTMSRLPFMGSKCFSMLAICPTYKKKPLTNVIMSFCLCAHANVVKYTNEAHVRQFFLQSNLLNHFNIFLDVHWPDG